MFQKFLHDYPYDGGSQPLFYLFYFLYILGSPLLEQLDSAFSSSSTKIIGHLGKKLRMWEMPVCDAPTWHFAPLYLCRHDATWDMGRQLVTSAFPFHCGPEDVNWQV